MNSTNMLKVIVAFLAGLVLALGGALIYVKSDTLHPSPQVAVAEAPPPPAIQSTPVKAPAVIDPAPAPVAAAEVESEPVPKEKAEPKRHKSRKTVREDEEAAAPRPIQALPRPETIHLAQNTPPPVDPASAASAEPAPQPAAPPPPPPQPKTVTLQPGTNITVRVDETLSTDHNYTGDTFRATLQTPIIQDGFIIADRGSRVLGRIVNAEKAGRVKGLAELSLALTTINTTDGQRIQIQTNTTGIQGPSSKKRDTAEVVGGSALGAIIGAIAGGGKGAAIGAGAGGAAGAGGVIATRGKPAVVQAETQLSFRLDAPVTITEKINQ